MSRERQPPQEPLEKIRGVIDQIDDHILLALGHVSIVAPKVFTEHPDVRYLGFYNDRCLEATDRVARLMKHRFKHTNIIGRIKYDREKEKQLREPSSSAENFTPTTVVIEVKNEKREKEVIERMTSLSQENSLNLEPEFIEQFWTGMMAESCSRQRNAISHLQRNELHSLASQEAA